ncbi:MAG: hypothetical protein WBL07_17660 [Thiothrix litoralis]|uniref:hypothetical protein n=1 Tax=Thiothrix litoralis TaxID=2891210 RepID=UPI003C75CAF5
MSIWWLATSKNEGHCSYDELKNRKLLAQGWSALGDLSKLRSLINDENNFKNTINKMVEDTYDCWIDKRNPGRIILNLLKFRENDIVICTEGTTVMGMAKVGKNPQYRYDNGDGKYEYAQTIYPVSEWKDWNTKIVTPPTTSTMGPVGINRYGKNNQEIMDAWEKL